MDALQTIGDKAYFPHTFELYATIKSEVTEWCPQEAEFWTAIQQESPTFKILSVTLSWFSHSLISCL